MKYLTLLELQKKLCGRGRTTIYRDIATGRLPRPIKLGSRNYWREDDIDSVMATLETAPRAVVNSDDQHGKRESIARAGVRK